MLRKGTNRNQKIEKLKLKGRKIMPINYSP